MNLTDKLRFRRGSVLSKLYQWKAMRIGADIPSSVTIGRDVKFPHNSLGTVIHPDVVIEDACVVYQNVTLGRQDAYAEAPANVKLTLVLHRGCIICAGAKVLASFGKPVHIGKGAIVGANAVLTHSIGDYEIWAGIPARLIGTATNETPPKEPLK